MNLIPAVIRYAGRMVTSSGNCVDRECQAGREIVLWRTVPTSENVVPPYRPFHPLLDAQQSSLFPSFTASRVTDGCYGSGYLPGMIRHRLHTINLDGRAELAKETCPPLPAYVPYTSPTGAEELLQLPGLYRWVSEWSILLPAHAVTGDIPSDCPTLRP